MFPARLEHCVELVSGTAKLLGDLADSVCAVTDVVRVHVRDVRSSAASATNTGGVAHVVDAVVSDASRWCEVQRCEGAGLAKHVSIDS